jgi:hypothetical protein
MVAARFYTGGTAPYSAVRLGGTAPYSAVRLGGTAPYSAVRLGGVENLTESGNSEFFAEGCISWWLTPIKNRPHGGSVSCLKSWRASPPPRSCPKAACPLPTCYNIHNA